MSRDSDAPNVCLFYNEAEYKDVLRRFYKHTFGYFTLDADAEQYLFEFTNGHPAALTSILLYVRKVGVQHDLQQPLLENFC